MVTIDATDKTIGRVASEAAHYLMGKHLVSYQKNIKPETLVQITNADKTKISEKKKDQKKYERYSGYPGGLRFDKLQKILDEKGIEEVYQRAVKRMLPDNKLRKLMLKNLTVTK